MILADQPTIFPDDLLVRVSSITDGTMLDRTGSTSPGVVEKNRTNFCELNAISYKATVLQKIVYDDHQSYDRIVTVTKMDTVQFQPALAADALFTQENGIGLLLPVADCVATVVFDPVLRSLALVHLGRHSTLTDLVSLIVGRFVENGSATADLLVWMSPSAGRNTYRLDHFDAEKQARWQDFCEKKSDGVYIDMAGYNRERFIDAGVLAPNIQLSTVNTMTDEAYYSHAAGDTGGRMAVLASMR